MKMCSLALDVAQAKSCKISSMFLERGENLLQYGKLQDKPIVRNQTSKLEFTQTKNRLF